MGSVSEVKTSAPGEAKGKFCMGVFNIFKEEDRAEYEDIRTKNNDASSGVKIESIREFTYKSSHTHKDDDGGQTTIVNEELHLVVQYWDNRPEKDQKGTPDEAQEAVSSWSPRAPR